MNELALFSGAGGGILGGKLLGWRTVCAVESHRYAASVLARRQNEGHLEPFPIWDDVCTFNGKPWKGIVDVVSGGFPCQDISVAGSGDGIKGKQSGLWVEMARIISEVQPKYVFVENSPALITRGIGRVLGDLASLGYDAEWGVMGAHHTGAPHKRDRIWIVGSNPSIKRLERQRENAGKKKKPQSRDVGTPVPNSNSIRPKAQKQTIQPRGESPLIRSWWETEPELGRVANGVARRMDRLRTIGNGQVPIVAATIFKTLLGRLND
jgi:DNA (cytosine-5)-methyltransferase 1